MSGRVTLVGAGPGDPALFTLGGLHAIREADLVLYDALVTPEVLAFAPAGAARVYVGKRAGEHAIAQREIERIMVDAARDGKRVVRLKGGDPFVFGRGAEEAQALHAAGVSFSVLPGVTSAVAAPAYAGIPLTHRCDGSSFVVVTGHEDPAKPESAIDWSRIAGASTIVVLMGVERLREIAGELMRHGVGAETPAALVQDGTRPTQRCVTGTLRTIADDAERAKIEAPAILVTGHVVALRDALRWFDLGPLFGKRVLVTRPESQAHRFARALASCGAEPVLAPAIAIAPPDDSAALAREIERLDECAWIVFLSRNGVESFFRALHGTQRDARAIGRVRIAAIGKKTAERLEHYGVRAELVSGRSTSEDVAADLLASTHPGERVLVVAAQENRDIVRSVLADAGRETVVAPAYKTVPAKDSAYAEKVARCDILTFASGSAVRGFAQLLGGHDAAADAARGRVVACIGPITADEAREVGLRVDVVPEEFTGDALIGALVAHYSAPA